MKILAIETSCDDSCIALAECSTSKFKLISNLISSQIEIHRKWGGVYPALARREHQKNLTPLLIQALEGANVLKKSKSEIQSSKLKKLESILGREKILSKKLIKFLSKYKKPKIDLIAVTIGPGLDPCLWTGVNFTKALSYFWEIPIIGINHIEAHIFANNRLSIIADKKNLPALALIVSGGHTQLILIKKLGDYKILGETRDDAAGEAFDKIARIIGLDYPGGPAIAAAAQKSNTKDRMSNRFETKLPRPMLNTKNYDFSFSGLKTAVLYDYKKRTKKERESKQYIQIMAGEAQQAIIDVLIKKTIKAAKDYRIKSILLGGGVSANKELRKQFQQRIKKENSRFNLYISPSEYCTDNAAMIAAVACFQRTAKSRTLDNWQNIKAQPNLRID
jgi:N6-L-threonylcarbamoyladenine synthase